MAEGYFKSEKGTPAKATERKEEIDGEPKTGFSSAGSNEQNLFEPTKGFGGSNPGAK